ncbi:hypothetical protein NP493_16g12057 [Ridgeia piscesae]|uniref:Uncharacterized protein n=1 Tax=Ridgeia piscesae TaxID=27915 RepID=A0AAD9PEX1_RIDPI|nr:hypothetical protein NP493_16g12057 [Ridgeia piscesae]
MKAAIFLVSLVFIWTLTDAQDPQHCETQCRYGFCCCKVSQEKPGVPRWPVIPPKTKFLGPICCKCCCDVMGFAHCNDGYQSIISADHNYC